MTPGHWQGWQGFWSSHLGQEVLAAEQALLQPLLERQQGYHQLSIGSLPAGDLFKSSAIRHHIEWRPSQETAEHPRCLIADPCLLPLPDDGIDLVILHHALELFASPHALLKEAARITLPKGELLILGFNPYSLWGLSRLLPAGLQAEPLRALRSARFLAEPRLNDWLEFLDLHPEQASRYLFHRPPSNRKGLLQRLRNLDQRLDQRNWPLAAIYLLRVKKRIGSPLQRVVQQGSSGWLPVQTVTSPTRNSLKTEQ